MYCATGTVAAADAHFCYGPGQYRHPSNATFFLTIVFIASSFGIAIRRHRRCLPMNQLGESFEMT